jgi:hypothetical protein
MLVKDLTEKGYRVLIGTPSYDMRISQMQLPMIYVSELPPVQFIPVAGAYIDRGRNRIVEAALSGEYDKALGGPPTHLLMLDSDAFPRDRFAIRKLLEADVPAISSLVAHKTFPSQWMVFDWKEPNNPANYQMRTREIARSLLEPFNLQEPYRDVFKIDACGYGMILIKIEVFEQVESPWFETSQACDLTYHGEDVVFHRKTEEVGIDTYAHGGALSMHQDGKKLYPDFPYSIAQWMNQYVKEFQSAGHSDES